MKEEREALALEMLKEVQKSSKRWFLISIILLVALVVSNIAWLIYEQQFETITTDEVQTIEDIENPENSNFTQTIN